MQPEMVSAFGVSVPAHSLALLFSFVVAGGVRRRESRRLGYDRDPAYRWVGVGAILGAILGAKLGMVLYVPPAEWGRVLLDTAGLVPSGKTVIGALAGGYAGVEVAKKLAGIQGSTGDAFAVALPLGLAFGRLGCVLGGCCYGAPTSAPIAIVRAGVSRHPVQLYEAALDLALAALMVALRPRVRRPGDLFKLCLVGYASIRVGIDPLRGDPRVFVGPVSAVQLFCLAAVVALVAALLRPQESVRAVA